MFTKTSAPGTRVQTDDRELTHNEQDSQKIMTQKFLVQIEDVDHTRWLIVPEKVRQLLEIIAHHIVYEGTEGPRPQITVIRDEIPETEACFGHNT